MHRSLLDPMVARRLVALALVVLAPVQLLANSTPGVGVDDATPPRLSVAALPLTAADTAASATTPTTSAPATAAPVPSGPSTPDAPAAPPVPGPPAAAPPPEAPLSSVAPVPTESPVERVHRAFVDGVPANWRAAVPTSLEVIAGATSWAHPDGRISISRSHADGGYAHLVDVVAHEFGHLIAFEFGSRRYAGAGPEGWPAPAHRPEEAWADCVQSAFTGRANPSHGLPPCDGARLDWVRRWLATPPA